MTLVWGTAEASAGLASEWTRGRGLPIAMGCLRLAAGGMLLVYAVHIVADVVVGVLLVKFRSRWAVHSLTSAPRDSKKTT